MIFELSKEKDEYFIKVKYNNETIWFKGQKNDKISYKDFISSLS